MAAPSVACPCCGARLPLDIDIVAVREQRLRCPFCVDLAMEVIAERVPTDNPFVTEHPQTVERGYRVAGVVFEERRGRGNGRRSKRRHGRRRG